MFILTIIESGLISQWNTLIVTNSDKLGFPTLLRGRVAEHKIAYAYISER